MNYTRLVARLLPCGVRRQLSLVALVIAKPYRHAMKLIFIHGAPASGKLTVARALLRSVPGRLFDNHAPIDLARTVFDFGAPGFWELVDVVWLSTLDLAARHGVPLIATTYCYAEPEDREAFERVEGILKRHDGEVLPVFLYCSEDEAARRVSNADRAERKKIASVESLNSFRARWNIVPVPRSNCLALDTGAMPPDATAQKIIRHFALLRNS